MAGVLATSFLVSRLLPPGRAEVAEPAEAAVGSRPHAADAAWSGSSPETSGGTHKAQRVDGQ